MHKSATKCNKTLDKWCKNKHGASKIMDTLETYQRIMMYSGKVIGCLGFSRRGVFIGEGASSEVVLVGLTTGGGRGPALGRAPGGVAHQWILSVSSSVLWKLR
jgi:hypothetical protein